MPGYICRNKGRKGDKDKEGGGGRRGGKRGGKRGGGGSSGGGEKIGQTKVPKTRYLQTITYVFARRRSRFQIWKA